MTTTESVFSFLKGEGYCPNQLGTVGVHFKAQGRAFLFVNNDEDENYFQLILPNIYTVDASNRGSVLEAANEVSRTVKVAKVWLDDDSANVGFEILLDSTPDVSDIIPRAIDILIGAQREFAVALAKYN